MDYCEYCDVSLIEVGRNAFGNLVYQCPECGNSMSNTRLPENLPEDFENIWVIEYWDDDYTWSEECYCFSEYYLAESFLLKNGWMETTDDKGHLLYKKDNAFAEIGSTDIFGITTYEECINE